MMISCVAVIHQIFVEVFEWEILHVRSTYIIYFGFENG